jgi:charged multivesicular body protein 3
VHCTLQSSRLNQTMMEMSREMMKAGIIDEMMSDAIDGAVDSEDMETETDEEVDRVRIVLLQRFAGVGIPDG